MFTTLCIHVFYTALNNKAVRGRQTRRVVIGLEMRELLRLAYMHDTRHIPLPHASFGIGKILVTSSSPKHNTCELWIS